MFDKDFYPTPRAVIDKMLLGVDIRNKIILEPSAGSGNIVEWLNDNAAKQVIACELNKDLAKIVKSKCTFLKHDFLEVTSEEISHVDFIIMNPPFSSEEKHILHAFEIAPSNCTIISLCNYSMLENGYSTQRKKIKELIKAQGRSEKFGDCFSTAERKTNAEIGCIWLYKQGTKENEFEGYFDCSEEEEIQQSGIVRHNEIRELVGRYVQAVSMFDSVMQKNKEINEITKPISDKNILFGAFKWGSSYVSNDSQITREEYKKDLQKQCWLKVFSYFKMDQYITKSVKENINKFVEKQTHVPFTVKNVYKMIELIVGTHSSRMKQVLIEVFEKICSYSSENSTAGEKWKTNSNYMINKKFIIPYVADHYNYGYKNEFVDIKLRGNTESISDLIKALCVLTGDNFNKLQSLIQFSNDTTNIGAGRSHFDISRSETDSMKKMEWGKWYDWTFFRIKAFKKGTMHFEFLDESLWMKFNIEVAKAKGWSLPCKTNATKKRKKTN